MPTLISETLSADHKRCDAVFAELEAAVSADDWTGADALFESYREAMANHLDFEEQRLFPAYERATGEPGGPTAVMVQEHQDMRALLEELHFSLQARDSEQFLGLAETLLILMQQHNIKEEQVLYPHADQALSEAEGSALAAQLNAADRP